MKCNYPLNYKSSHPPLCGKPALWRAKIGMTGHLTDLIVCEEHRVKVSHHLDWKAIQ